MSLKSQLYKSIRGMPLCIAGGYIDLDNKILLDMLTRGPESKDMLPRLVGITEDLFQGPNVTMIEQIFNKSRGSQDPDRHLFQEMVVMNEDLIHVFIRGKSFNNHIVTFIFEGEMNMGLSLSKSRKEIPYLENEVALLRKQI
jgi:hypothetical protein